MKILLIKILIFLVILFFVSCNNNVPNSQLINNITDTFNPNKYELFLSLRSRNEIPESEKNNQFYIPNDISYSEYTQRYEYYYRTLCFQIFEDTIQFSELSGIVLKRGNELWKILPKNLNCTHPLVSDTSIIFEINASPFEQFSEDNFSGEKTFNKYFGNISDYEEYISERIKDLFLFHIGEVVFVCSDFIVYAFVEYNYSGGASTYTNSGFETFYFDTINKPELFIEIKEKDESSVSYGLIRYHGEWEPRKRMHNWCHGTTYEDNFFTGIFNPEILSDKKLPFDWTNLKTTFPSIVDAFTTPDNDYIFILTKNDITIYKLNNNNNIDMNKLQTITLNLNECIVGINW